MFWGSGGDVDHLRSCQNNPLACSSIFQSSSEQLCFRFRYEIRFTSQTRKAKHANTNFHISKLSNLSSTKYSMRYVIKILPSRLRKQKCDYFLSFKLFLLQDCDLFTFKVCLTMVNQLQVHFSTFFYFFYSVVKRI